MRAAVRVIVLRPGQTPTVEMILDSVAGLQAVIGGYFELHRIDVDGTMVDLYCDEMGKLEHLPPNRYIEDLAEVVVGPILLSSGAFSPTGAMASFSDDEIARLMPLVSAWPMAIRRSTTD